MSKAGNSMIGQVRSVVCPLALFHKWHTCLAHLQGLEVRCVRWGWGTTSAHFLWKH